MYEDKLSNLSFVIPQGWHLVSDKLGQATLESDEGEGRLIVVRSNQWDPTPASRKQQYAAAGVTRSQMNTGVFTKESMVGAVNGNPDHFELVERSGVSFYTGSDRYETGDYTFYIGAQEGYLMIFIFSGMQEDASAVVNEVMDHLTFREMDAI